MVILFFVSSLPLAIAESENIGIVYWKHEIVSPNSFVDIFVEDDDMNKKEYPNFADKFTIFVWSDSSPGGLEIQVVETGVYSGIFKGTVYVADSGETAKNRLVSMPGDVLYAKYVDSTLPNGSTTDIISAAVVKISGKDMNEFLNQLDPELRYQKHSSDKVPTWIKNNAGWWADGSIDDDSFIQGIQFLIKEKIIQVDSTSSSQKSDVIPTWVKNNARWWAQGQITESDFLSGINHLVNTGIINISNDSKENISDTDSELSECQSIKSAYKRLNCEKEIKQKLEFAKIKETSTSFEVGPVTFYYPGIGSPGNDFEISDSGQAMLRLRIMVENNSSENVTLKCTGPSVCSYDVWDGQKAFKYAGMDFVSGQIVVKPDSAFVFNMMFGPNIGYGGTTFEYDESKEYFFRINESWGSGMIPLRINR